MVDIEGEFELWTPLDDIEFPNIDNEINTYIIRGDDGTSKKDSDSTIEENIEEKDFSTVNGNKGNASKKTATVVEFDTNLKNNSKDKGKSSVMGKMKGLFSKKSATMKKYDKTEHKKLMGVLILNNEFNNLAEAIVKKVSEKEEVTDKIRFQIHNQLMNSELFETIAKSDPDDKETEEGLQYIAEKFTESKDDNIKNIIQLIKGEDDGEQVKKEQGEDVKQEDNQVGGGKKLLKWIKALKTTLKHAELGAHLQEVVRLPKKNLFLTLNFVEDTKENNENKNKPSRDVYMNTEATQTNTKSMLDQLILELGDHIHEANKIKDGNKGQTSDNNEGKTIDQ